MSCYFDSYFLSGKQTGVLGPGPGQRPGRQGQEPAPSLTRAPVGTRSFPGGRAATFAALSPSRPRSALHCRRLAQAEFKSDPGRCSQPSLTRPVCEMGMCDTARSAASTLRDSTGARVAACVSWSSLFLSLLQSRGDQGGRSLSSGGSKTGGLEGGLWALLSVRFPPCEMGSRHAFLMGPWQEIRVHSRTHLQAELLSFSLLYFPQTFHFPALPRTDPDLNPKRVEPALSRSGLRSKSLLWNHPSLQHNQVEGWELGWGPSMGRQPPPPSLAKGAKCQH